MGICSTKLEERGGGGGGKFACGTYAYATSQLEEIRRLHRSLNTSFDEENDEHERILRSTWRSLIPEIAFKRKGNEWKRIGFQGKDPVTDVRAAGMLSLACYAFFSGFYTHGCRKIVSDITSRDVEHYYPIATTAVVITSKLCECLAIARHMRGPVSEADMTALARGERRARMIGKLIVKDTKYDSLRRSRWACNAFYEIFSYALSDFHLEFVEKKSTYFDCQHVLDVVIARLDAYCVDADDLASLRKLYIGRNPKMKFMLTGCGGRSRGWRLLRGIVRSDRDQREVSDIYKSFSKMLLRHRRSQESDATKDDADDVSTKDIMHKITGQSSDVAAVVPTPEARPSATTKRE